MNSVSGYKFTRVAKKSAAAYRTVPCERVALVPGGTAADDEPIRNRSSVQSL